MFRPFAHLPTACCCVLLKVVAQNLKLVKLLSQQLPTFPPFRDRRSVAQQCLIRCTALPTFLGPRTCITYALQSLMGFILHTMHCSSQHCWELLHPFVRHYQHWRNSSQQCWELLRSFARGFAFPLYPGLKQKRLCNWPPTCTVVTISSVPWFAITVKGTFGVDAGGIVATIVRADLALVYVWNKMLGEFSRRVRTLRIN